MSGRVPTTPAAAIPDVSRLARRRQAAATVADGQFRERKERIVAVAAELFAAIGYERTTFREIGERAGMDRSTVYYYYSSKEELLQDVLHELIAANLERVAAIAHGSGSAAEKLSLIVRDMMDSYARNYPHQYAFARADIDHLRATGDAKTIEILDLAAAYVEAIIGVVAEGQRTGEFDRYADARVLGMGIVGMVNWTFRWYRPGGPYDADTIGAAFAQLALRGVQRPTEPT